MTRFSLLALGAATIGLAGCSVSEHKDENGARTVDIKADVGGVKADVDTRRGGNVSVDGTSVEIGDGDVRAQVRTNDNRSISVTTNRQ